MQLFLQEDKLKFLEFEFEILESRAKLSLN